MIRETQHFVKYQPQALSSLFSSYELEGYAL